MTPIQGQPKRGYLASLAVFPPLIYPFQFNPDQRTDTKRASWASERQAAQGGDKSRDATATSTAATGVKAGTVFDLMNRPDVAALLGRISGAGLLSYSEGGDRTLSFNFRIDGREQRPGEPSRRRSDDGNILIDLAILRSFVYPSVDLLNILSHVMQEKPVPWGEALFAHPPPALLVIGDLSMECVVTELRVTETQFNENLDPVVAEVSLSVTEKVDSLSFIADTAKRMARALYGSAYEALPALSVR